MGLSKDLESRGMHANPHRLGPFSRELLSTASQGPVPHSVPGVHPEHQLVLRG